METDLNMDGHKIENIATNSNYVISKQWMISNEILQTESDYIHYGNFGIQYGIRYSKIHIPFIKCSIVTK